MPPVVICKGVGEQLQHDDVLVPDTKLYGVTGGSPSLPVVAIDINAEGLSLAGEQQQQFLSCCSKNARYGNNEDGSLKLDSDIVVAPFGRGDGVPVVAGYPPKRDFSSKCDIVRRCCVRACEGFRILPAERDMGAG